jgi:hypothetical protein
MELSVKVRPFAGERHPQDTELDNRRMIRTQTMKTPGFTAENSLFNTGGHYAPMALYFDVSRAESAVPARTFGPPPPPACTPRCGPCQPDSSSPTGCSMTCQTAQCEPLDKACRGCVVCPPGQSACPSGACVDLNNDMQNCGSCGHVCPAGSTSCQGGTCYPTPEVCGECTRNCDVVCCDGGGIVKCYPNPQTNSTCSTQCCFEIAPGQQSCSLVGCGCL